MSLSLIVAMDQDGVIGRDGTMPWHLSDDLRRFRRITMGHTIVMGRKTFDSIGRVLPGRRTVVVSRQENLVIRGAVVVADIDSALQPDGTGEVFVVGGGEIYQLALPRVERMYITRVRCRVDGDTRFPAVDWRQWETTERHFHAADERNDFDMVFEVLQRLDDSDKPAR